MLYKFKNEQLIAITLIILGIIMRITPHPPNFSPVTAIALFGGAKLGGWWGILIPLSAMAVSDYLLLYINPYQIDLSGVKSLSAMFHETTLFVWGGFLVSALIGKLLQKVKDPKLIVLATLVASLQFFLITNFGVWFAGFYPQTFDGLMQSYLLGLPFFRMTILGDLFYTTIFFGGYYLIYRLLEKPSLIKSK